MTLPNQNYEDIVVVGDRAYMTAKKVADDLHITKTTIHSWVNSRQMPCFRIGQMYLFDPDELNTWIQNQRPKRGRARKTETGRNKQNRRTRL
jgi:excisionase family DNA binding protein